jgi:uncharacterized membrane protein YfbV (UPF0208 family)
MHGVRRGTPRLSGRRSKSGVGELALFVAFAAVSCWVLALNLWLVIRHGDVWSGTDGLAAQDQMQYLAWIRDASEHGLASNQFVLDSTPHDFIQPLVAVSAGLTALGVAPWIALLLWKPVAIGGCYRAVRGFVWATVEGQTERVAALVAALFFTGWGVVALRAVDSHANGIYWSVVTNEMWLPYSMWGYTFAAIAFASMVGTLVVYARDRDRGKVGWAAPALGALAAWVHPWQGQTLLVILFASEAVLWRGRTRPSLKPLALTASATALPLAYYAVLRRADTSWEEASAAGHKIWPLWVVLLSLLPLAVPALLAYRARPRTFLEAALRVWPPVAIAVVFVDQALGANGVLHVLLGLSVPLAVLAVLGLRSISARQPPFAAVVAAAFVIVAPPVYEQLRTANQTVRAVYNAQDANFITADENDALDWLDRARGSGGVLTIPYLGAAVPGRTGRPTFVGNTFWSPDYYQRAIRFLELVNGQPPQAAQAFVRSTGARFVLTGCPAPIDLRPSLAGILVSTHTFGCARVYEVRTGLDSPHPRP